MERSQSLALDSILVSLRDRRLIGATNDRRIRVWDATPLPE